MAANWSIVLPLAEDGVSDAVYVLGRHPVYEVAARLCGPQLQGHCTPKTHKQSEKTKDIVAAFASISKSHDSASKNKYIPVTMNKQINWIIPNVKKTVKPRMISYPNLN